MARLVFILHRGEDPHRYADELSRRLPEILLAGTVSTDRPFAAGAYPRLYWVVPAARVAATLRSAARHEAVLSVGTWDVPRDNLNDTIWQTQTGRWINPTTRNDCVPAGTWCYDTTAKLFANGVTGRGQILANLDRGLENDDCHFRYGPNISDATIPNVTVHQPDVLPPTDTTYLKPGNKVVAYYCVYRPPCGPEPFDNVNPQRPFHGTKTTACAVGDEFFVSAAHAGAERDDPADDEEQLAASQVFANLIDHHQTLDSTAPGAQVIVQDFDAIDCPPSPQPGPLPLLDCLEQAYGTGRGARVHTNQWTTSSFGTDFSYGDHPADADLQAWRLRDLLITWCAGNIPSGGPPPSPAEDGTLHPEGHLKNGITVGASIGPGPDISLASFSAHGPGAPHRVKPDLVAPGQVLSLYEPMLPNFTEDGSGSGDNACADAMPPPGPQEGTSLSAPIVAGLALDVRQYFVDGYYPGGAPSLSMGFIPTNALLKAVLINGTRNMPGQYTADNGQGGARGDRPTHGQGWGFPVVDDTLFFAGDPTNPPVPNPPFPGPYDGLPGAERSCLRVLNDVPNGLRLASVINDDRAGILDSFQGAIRDAETQTFSLWVEDTEDLHVTLTWSDPPPSPALWYLYPILQNDLDLELIDPLGRAWRPNPGINMTAPDRTWSGGFTVLADETCPVEPGCASVCPPGTLERDHTQASPPTCDFDSRDGNDDFDTDMTDPSGDDAANNVENVFIAAANPDFVRGWWTVRVIAFDVPGAGLSNQVALPNFTNQDASTEYDVIDDTNQGYALVASGKLATSHGVPHFARGLYRCETSEADSAQVFLDDADATEGDVIVVETAAGDCDRFRVHGVPPMPDPMTPPRFFATDPFPLRDVDDGVSPSACDGATPDGDGIVVSTDDGLVTATYVDVTDGRVVRATTRFTCRDLRLLWAGEPLMPSVAVKDGCDAGTENSGLNPNEGAVIEVTVTNTTPVPTQDTWFRLVPFNADVVTSGGTIARDFEAEGQPDGTQALAFSVFVPASVNCMTNPTAMLRFRLEVYGADGFRDRIYFGLPLNCTEGTVGAATYPGEVPRTVKVAKDQDSNLIIVWDPVINASRYNVWRGTISALQTGRYDHTIPGAPDDFTLFCNEAGSPALLINNATYVGSPSANYYYLVTAERECGTAGLVLDGPSGFANRDRDDAFEPDEARPLGYLPVHPWDDPGTPANPDDTDWCRP
jgi:hypothetical protein